VVLTGDPSKALRPSTSATALALVPFEDREIELAALQVAV
jgi:hypothetical protein